MPNDIGNAARMLNMAEAAIHADAIASDLARGDRGAVLRRLTAFLDAGTAVEHERDRLARELERGRGIVRQMLNVNGIVDRINGRVEPETPFEREARTFAAGDAKQETPHG